MELENLQERINLWDNDFENNTKRKRISQERAFLYEELRALLPKNKQEIIFRLDENVGEIMATYQDNYYLYGYRDGYLEVCKRCRRFLSK